MQDTNGASFDAASLVDDPADIDLMNEIVSEGYTSISASNWNWVESGAHLMEPTITTLPPADQDDIRAKTSHIPGQAEREATVQRLAMERLRIRAQEGRLKAGASIDRDGHVAAEWVDIAGQIAELNAEQDRISAELSEIVRYDTEIDFATGETKAVPVFRHTGEAVRMRSARLAEIAHYISRLEGPEATARIADAAKRELVRRKRLQEALELEPAAKQRAAEIERERRIEERAQQIANRDRAR